MIGIGLPVSVFALVEGESILSLAPLWRCRADVPAMRSDTHVALPAWNGLLQVYGALFLPVIFAMLFELNLDAWVNARINYEVLLD